MILAIETSVPESSICLVDQGDRIFGHCFLNGRNHNSQIFVALQEVGAVLAGRKLDCIIVGTGPGSYSGVRVGIASAQGLAVIHGCPTVGIGSLAATPVARSSERSMAIGDARRGLYYVTPILDSGLAMEAELMDEAAFLEKLESAISSNTALFSLDDLSSADCADDLPTEILRTKPEAALLIDIWENLCDEEKNSLLQQPLSPQYLRAPFTSKAKAGHPLLR